MQPRTADGLGERRAAGSNAARTHCLCEGQSRQAVDAGKVRRIAITSATRFRGLPDLPTVSETVPGVVLDGFFAVVGPSGTPSDIIVRLNQEIGKYLESSEVQQRLISFGLDTDGVGTPEGTAQAIRELQEHWRALAKELDIVPQ